MTLTHMMCWGGSGGCGLSSPTHRGGRAVLWSIWGPGLTYARGPQRRPRAGREAHQEGGKVQ